MPELPIPDFEWDNGKAAENLRKHLVSFPYAARAFLDPQRLDAPDSRRDYGEDRRITMGLIDGRLFVVVYTIRASKLRLISARKANHREQKDHHDEVHTRSGASAAPDA